MARNKRDHGGGLDAAVAHWGGARADWLDLSTGINPVPYPLPDFQPKDWNALPDAAADAALIEAARQFWNIPEGADILAAPGCSALIAQIPTLSDAAKVQIEERTYNEHAASFRECGWDVIADPADVRVLVHPNNPTGSFHDRPQLGHMAIIDESFCDIAPHRSMIDLADQPGVLVLKSFGKFWGLAGLRLGFVVGDPKLVEKLRRGMGPWPVSGPALRVGAAALNDPVWADETRLRLTTDATRLDQIMTKVAAKPIGETPLFRTYEVKDAQAVHNQLCKAHILTRIFPYADNWIRLGLPGPADWQRLEAAL